VGIYEVTSLLGTKIIFEKHQRNCFRPKLWNASYYKNGLLDFAQKLGIEKTY
jgi:hypothetical protein